MLAALAWRNLWRQPRRTILSLLSIAFASALLVFALSFQTGVYSTMTEATLRILDGFAQVQPAGYADDPDIKRTIADAGPLAARLCEVRGVSAAAPRVNSFAILANGQRSYGAAVIGVDPASEAKVSSLAASVKTGRYLRPGDSAAAVLGDALARDLRLSVGDKVTLLGSAVDGSVAADVLTVVGLYHTGVPDMDRAILEMPLARAQAMFALGDRANTIAIGGSELSSVDAALPTLSRLAAKEGLKVQDWAALEPSLRDTFTLKYATSMFFYATLVFVVAFIILNTLLMSVLERTREFGMLLAIGMRPSLIGGMVWLELITLALIGASLGIAIGGGVSLWLEARGVVFSAFKDVLAQYGLPDRLYPSFTLLSASLGPGAITLAVCLGGIVPYLHVRRLQAASAMRAA